MTARASAAFLFFYFSLLESLHVTLDRTCTTTVAEWCELARSSRGSARDVVCVGVVKCVVQPLNVVKVLSLKKLRFLFYSTLSDTSRKALGNYV